MPTPDEAAEFSLEETEEWLIANLCADTRCRGDRPYRYALTHLNIVEASSCVMKLQFIGDRRPATIPMVDVWQIDIRAPALDDATVVIRWWADAERDAWYLEDLNNRMDNAGWLTQAGSAIFVLRIIGPREKEDGNGLALMLNRYADLCQNQ
jgi:hypothetical protein